MKLEVPYASRFTGAAPGTPKVLDRLAVVVEDSRASVDVISSQVYISPSRIVIARHGHSLCHQQSAL